MGDYMSEHHYFIRGLSVDLDSYSGVMKALSGEFTLERNPIEEVERSNMARKEIVRNRIKELEEEYEKLNKWGDDDFANGTVLKFKAQYNEGGKFYTFAALKVAYKWYITSPSLNDAGYTWDEFVEFLAAKNKVKGMKMATGWTGV